MNIKKIVLIAVVLLIAVVAVMYLLIIISQPPKPPHLNVTSSLEFTVIDSGVLDYGIEKQSYGRVGGIERRDVAYILSQVTGKYIKDVDINVELFEDQIPKDIYLLDYSSADFRGCIECEGLLEFRDSLEKSLKTYGLLDQNATLNQIKIHQLDSLTRRSVLIVPTGKIPSQLVGLESGPDLSELTKKGFVIIFIGSELRQSLKRNGEVLTIPTGNLRKYNISYQERSDLNTMPPFKLKSPAFIISNNVVYGSMSVVKNYDGYFFVLPRSIDIGWNSNGTDAAEDVTRVIYEVAWQRSLTDGSLHLNSSEIKESESNRSMIFLKPYPNVEGWARIYILTNTSNNVPFYSVYERRITRTVYGTMGHKSTAARGEGDFTIAFQLAVNFTKPKDANISVVIYDEDMGFVGRQLAQRDIKLSQGQYSFSSNFIVDLNSGRYILKAEDDEGYVYAQSLLYVPPILLMFDVPRPYWDMEPQIIPFRVVLEADPLLEGSSPAPLVNRRVFVNVNRSPNVNIFSSPTPLTTDAGGRFNYTPPSGYVFDYGEYTFKVNVSGEVLTINAKRTKTAGWFDNPINVVIVVFIIIIGVAGVLLRRPEKPLYTIDVPDFPPLEKVVIPISKFSVLSLFDSVNKEYKWNFMPLSAQELKNEMRRKITHKGVPILITDYNLDRVLNELIESGDVVKALNLYGLKQWESKGGRSIGYLALFRLLRNFFINNAIPFTDLNERKDCDIFATVKGEGVCIHIYTDENTFRKALKLISAGKNFVIFESKREMDEVVKKLELSYTPTAIILKSEISSGPITLTQPGSFGVILGR